VSRTAEPARARHRGAGPLHWILALALLLWALCASATTPPAPVPLDPAGEVDLLPHGRLYEADGSAPPAAAEQLGGWLSRLKPATGVDPLGGRYWLHAVVRNDSSVTRWVLDPHASLVERIEAHVLQAGQPPQRFSSGYVAEQLQYMLHYGGNVALAPGAVAHVLLYLESPYFARTPRVGMITQAGYRSVVLTENLLMLWALGAVLTLALYNLFLFWGTRDRALLYYALYMLSLLAGWTLTLHIGAQWLGWHDLRWHYVGLFLLPVFNPLFCIHFLQMRRLTPVLTRLAWGIVVLSLLLLPSCFLALSVAHLLCSAVISLFLPLAIVAGWKSLRSGFRPARYFLAGFLVLAAPGAILLPANLGFFDTPVRNPELLSLLGCAVDGLLLALALADKIRLLAHQKDEYLHRLNHALDQTRTDHLTGILNRHAFDQMLAQAAGHGAAGARRVLLAIIDLDGLKTINDTQGHTQGDALLCAFARLLETLRDEGMAVFRLGGDEFAVLGRADDAGRLRTALPMLEARLRAAGFHDSGVSFGLALGHEAPSTEALLHLADERMYAHKAGKGAARRAQPLPTDAGDAPRQHHA
jgi:diguanylate cyclase (GGDEF)-like protein